MAWPNNIAAMKSLEEQAVIIASQEGIITFINKQFTLHYGWQKEDLVNRALTLIIPPSLVDAHNLGFSRFLLTEQATLLQQELSLELMTKDQQMVNTNHYIIGEKVQDDWVFGAIISPLGDAHVP